MANKTAAFVADTSLEGKTAVIQLIGEINIEADAAMSTAYDQAETADAQNIRLDFSQVTYINSTGIALIVGLLARARAAHRPIAAVGLSDHYREIFAITRLSDFIEIQ
jgi:anti-sigma B factor antagonist